MKYRIAIILLVMLVLPSKAVPQTPSVKLTDVLHQIETAFKVKISFSPSVTDEILVRPVTMGDDLTVAVGTALNGTGLACKMVNSKFMVIYKAPQAAAEPVKKHTPVLLFEPEPEPVRDTVKLSTPEPIYGKVNDNTAGEILFSPREAGPVVVSSVDKSTLADVAVKTNLLYDAYASMNLGVEFGLAPGWSVDLSGTYNPWTSTYGRKHKVLIAQPELRYWPCQRFSGSFFGIHAHAGIFNVEDDYRYEGYLAGAGVSYGYHWILGSRLSLEANLGIGYTYVQQEKFRCVNCGSRLDSGHKNYFSPTKAAVSLVYMIK